MSNSRGRILFVDDEEMLVNVVPRMLAAEGFDVDYAQSGAEAVRKYGEALKGERPFDLVIMDLQIPGELNGKEAAFEIRKIDPRARCVASSGYVMDSMAAQFKANGFSGMIAKPYTADELRKVLDEFFEPAKRG